jgi:hypothetical protein
MERNILANHRKRFTVLLPSKLGVKTVRYLTLGEIALRTKARVFFAAKEFLLLEKGKKLHFSRCPKNYNDALQSTW